MAPFRPNIPTNFRTLRISRKKLDLYAPLLVLGAWILFGFYAFVAAN
jgi:cell division protein FtsW (lipid II flippase)